ncbi:MAG: hypothetical protein M3545_12385 [Acidobacteriota bacterium]|nr:hypothetical protein [Acidobacteriota bacterium]
MTTDLGGAATLLRTAKAVDVRISTSALDHNAALHRLVGRVQPACCTRGWLWVDDLDNPATGASVFYAAGFVTGSDGTANTSAHLDADALPRGIDVLLGNGLMPGNVFGAEIHLLIRSHGSLIPWRVAQKIGSVDGACDVNVCAEQQAVGFNAVR